jgi:3'-phosphoadenosine 5'-phosphosulfate sulfotransferase (PAPS reductase)/FAD synthetase|tara:strand:+ start:26179 stop:27108 length:930 start_codon:yes stop_codon:yes gene_type:complete
MTKFETGTTKLFEAEIKAEIEAGAMFVVNHSGGKDSQAMYAVIKSLVPADQITVVHADLVGADWSDLQDHINANIEHDLRVITAQHGRGEIGDVNKKTGEVTRQADFFSMVRARHVKNQSNLAEKIEAGDTKATLAAPFPAPNLSRQCTSDLKTGPITKIYTQMNNKEGITRFVDCIGLRAEESDDRAEKNPWTKSNKSNTKRHIIEFLPIQDILEDRVWEIIEQDGQTRHFAYDLGMERLSCVFCIYSSDEDLRIAAKANPDLYKKYVELEKEVGFTLKMDRRGLEAHTGIKVETDPMAIPEFLKRVA